MLSVHGPAGSCWNGGLITASVFDLDLGGGSTIRAGRAGILLCSLPCSCPVNKQYRG